MAQHLEQFCTECGTPLQAGQRFCSNCGASISAGASAPTAAVSQTPPGPLAGDPTVASLSIQPTALAADGAVDREGPARPAAFMQNPPANNQASPAVPPPPPPAVYNPYTASVSPGYTPAPSVGNFTPTLAPDRTPAPIPDYARKPKNGHGCLATSIVLLAVLAVGIGGFILFNKLHSSPNTGNTTPPTATSGGANNGSTPSSNNGTTPAAPVSSSEQLGLKITYASVNITIVSAQLASSFPDDTSTPGAAGMVRVNLQENNTSSSNPDYVFSDAMLLVLPGGNTVKVVNYKDGISPDTGVNRSNWLDFPIDVHVALNQLVLRVGQTTENQMDIPLQAGANLSKYQDKSSSPNAQFQYSGVNWTLKTATLSYSYSDRQATTGNIYVVLTLGAVNNSSNDFINSPSNYMRLQVSGTSAQASGNSTFPLSISPGTTTSGAVAFLMPQGTTSFTLVMLAQPNNNPPVPQVSQTFQIQ